MEMFDIVKFEKEKAIARFNCFGRIAKLWQFFEVLVVLALISWSTTRVPAVFRIAAAYLIEFSTYLFNHHVVFLIGNAIIVLLFLLCRQNDAVSPSGGGDLYSDYVKHSEASAVAASASHPTDVPPPETAYSSWAEDGGGDEEKQIVVCTEEILAIPQCDDVAAAIEKATREIKRFQRTQSEKLKREIGVTPQPELWRSETQNRRRKVSSGERFDAADIERLSSEEFQRTVDAFIEKNWCKKKKHNQFDEYGKYQLLKMA